MAWVACPFYPRSGRVENTKKRQQARRAKRQKQADQPPVATRSSRRCSTRARTSHTARAPRVSRAAARGTPVASGERSSRNPHPQQQARPLLACALRALRACAARRAQRRGAPLLRAARVRVSADPRAPRRGGGERGTGTYHPHHRHPRACVRAGLARAKSPRLEQI